ncbi:MAG: DNA mismatch repair endonuclease MutL [Gammaproteobacteria bacterium]
MSRIRKLDPHVINQIAAGEVIERPASVLKELIENSLDAGASKIQVSIQEGGLLALSVIDNGLGINKADLELALTQHATSKIASMDELNHLHSFGFRGEALASIASVSRFELCSRTPDAEHGHKISVGQYSNLLPHTEPLAMPQGTAVHVRDLFYNIPARRKFLASPKTELLRLEDMFLRLALSRYDVEFSLKQAAGKYRYQFPALTTHPHSFSEKFSQGRACLSEASLATAGQNFCEKLYVQRIGKIAGKTFLEQSHFIENQHPDAGLKFWGWIAPQTGVKQGSRLQYFFVNGRIIKDKLINHAIKQAWLDCQGQSQNFNPNFRTNLPPAFVLYLELDPEAFDVNVHPTKYEVRFNDSRLIHGFIYKSLLNTLSNQVQKQALAQLPSMQPSMQLEISKQNQNPNQNLNLDLDLDSILSHSIQSLKPLKTLKLINFINLGHTALVYTTDHVFAFNLQAIACQEFLEAPSKPLLFPKKIEIPENSDFLEEKLRPLGFEFSTLNTHSLLLRQAPQGLNLDFWQENFQSYYPELKRLPQHLISRALFWDAVIINPLNNLETAQAFLKKYENKPNCIKILSYSHLHDYFWPAYHKEPLSHV